VDAELSDSRHVAMLRRGAITAQRSAMMRRPRRCILL
jgi:hypothetical protein